jgi:pimeloyl-ACP methyl ester carboxylesterase
MKKPLAGLAIAIALVGGAQAQTQKPVIVLVHGAFADASSWNGVIQILEKDGYHVVAVANPLRGVKADADYVADIVANIGAPTVLVGHSYGGSVISEAVHEHSGVKALVYVSAFAPDVGETAAGLASRFPGSTLGPALAPPVRLSTGGNDLYVRQDKFHEQFAADLPDAEARLMAATQRPIAESPLNEAEVAADWKTLPSWFIYGDQDKNIPPDALAYMAKRARARETVVMKGGSHVVMVSRPEAVARVIEDAAAAE